MLELEYGPNDIVDFGTILEGALARKCGYFEATI